MNDQTSYTTVLHQLMSGGAGCGIAGFFTNPMDVVKIRNQQFGGAKYGSFLGTFRVILVDEGLRGLLKGASASVLREITYSSFRMGMYEPIKHMVKNVSDADINSPLVKWGSAYVSGAIGSALFNPVDLLKVRFQSQLPGDPVPYPSISQGFAMVYRVDGVRGLWKGTTATVTRAALLTSAQLGTYDIFKNNLLVAKLQFGKEDNSTHFIASLLASLAATTAANPADVIKTRVMNDVDGAIGGSGKHFRHLLKHEGPMAFMKGWTASYCRIGPHTVLSFILIEKFRQLLGLQTY